MKNLLVLLSVLILSACSNADQNSRAADQFVVNKATTNCNCRVQNTKERPQVGSQHLGPFKTKAEAIKAMCDDIDPNMEDKNKCWTTTPADICPKPDSSGMILKARSGRSVIHTTVAGIWQSVCEDGNSLPLCSHRGTWFGPERATKNEADADGVEHHKKCKNHNPETFQW